MVRGFASAEVFFFQAQGSAELVLVFLAVQELGRERVHLLAELGGRGGRAFSSLGQELDPLRLPLPFALGPGDLCFDGVQGFLALLERLLEVPDLSPPVGELLLPGLEAMADLPFRGQAGFELAGGLGVASFELAQPPAEVEPRQLADLLAELPVAHRRLGLALQRVLRPADLGNDVLEADEVLLARSQLALGLFFLVFVEGRPRRLLEKHPLFGRLGREERPDGPLLDDEIFLLGHGPFPERILDVLEAGGLAVEAVLAFSGAEDPMVDDRLLFLQVLEKEAHIGHPQRRPLGVSVEDDVLDLFSAKPLLPLAPQHPEDGVDDVAFSGAVGPDDRRDPGMKDDLRPLGEGLESLDLELLDDHGTAIVDNLPRF